MANFKQVSNYLNADELKGMRADVRKRIVKIYNKLPDDSIFKIASLSGIVKKGWYSRAKETIQSLFAYPDTELFSAILASTSPQQSVRLNMIMTIRIYGKWLKQGKPTDDKQLNKLARLSDLKCRRLNTIRSFKREAISGFKVSNFLNNLLGDLNSVTIDTWMMEFADLKAYSAQSKYVYLAYVAKIRKVANDMGLKPAEVQETIWSYIYSKQNNVNIKDVPEFSELLIGDELIQQELKNVIA